jgi:hypothetical protein
MNTETEGGIWRRRLLIGEIIEKQVNLWTVVGEKIWLILSIMQ